MLMTLIRRVFVCVLDSKRQKKNSASAKQDICFIWASKALCSFMLASDFTVLSCHGPQMQILFKRFKWSCHWDLYRKVIWPESAVTLLAAHVCVFFLLDAICVTQFKMVLMFIIILWLFLKQLPKKRKEKESKVKIFETPYFISLLVNDVKLYAKLFLLVVRVALWCPCKILTRLCHIVPKCYS